MEDEFQDIPSDYFDKEPENKDTWYKMGGIKPDDFQEGTLITILKNKIPLKDPMAMGMGGTTPKGYYSEVSGTNNIDTDNFFREIFSMIENTKGGGTILFVEAVNLPYLLLRVWNRYDEFWEEKMIIRDVRDTNFVKVKKQFALKQGIVFYKNGKVKLKVNL